RRSGLFKLLPPALIQCNSKFACCCARTGRGFCLRQLPFGRAQLPNPGLDHLPDGEGREPAAPEKGRRAGCTGGTAAGCTTADGDPRSAVAAPIKREAAAVAAAASLYAGNVVAVTRPTWKRPAG